MQEKMKNEKGKLEMKNENEINNKMDNIIKKFGFESPVTIVFCTLCEKTKDEKEIEKAYSDIISKA